MSSVTRVQCRISAVCGQWRGRCLSADVD